MNGHINRRAAWLASLGLIVLAACGDGESRSMEQVFADIDDLGAEILEVVGGPTGAEFDVGDREMLATVGDLTGRFGDLYGELAEVAPAEYRDRFGECAEFFHKYGEALKKGPKAAISMAEETVDDPGQACEEAVGELGGPKL